MESKIRTIIIEDDTNAVDYLSSILSSNLKNIDLIGVSNNITDAIRFIDSKKPELVFMDIELTDGNSFEIFNQLHFTDFEVIFVTAFDDYLKSAIDHYAFSFVVKPYEPKKIVEIVNRYLKLKKRLFSMNKYNALSNFLQSNDAQLLLNIGNEHISIKMNEIVKCVSDGNYTSVYMTNGEKHLALHSLKYYESLFTNKGFFKAHRSTLINIAHISSIYKKETIILTNNDKINVSIRNRSNLTNLLNTFS